MRDPGNEVIRFKLDKNTPGVLVKMRWFQIDKSPRLISVEREWERVKIRTRGLR